MNQQNVLLIVLDTVRASSTALDSREITPTIQEEMRRGATFQRAIAPTPWSLSSHASMWTGKYASEHGTTLDNQYLQENQETLAELLSESGYRTGIFTPNLFTSAAFGMDRGFEQKSFALDDKLFNQGVSIKQFALGTSWTSKQEFSRKLLKECFSNYPVKSLSNLAYSKLRTLISRNEDVERKYWDKKIVDDALQFINQQSKSKRPFFCFVNILSAHGPWEYDPNKLRKIGVEPEEYGSEKKWKWLASVSESQWPYAAGELELTDHELEMLTHLYESWVHVADQYAEKLISAVDEVGLLDDTTIILTADHGEAIGNNSVLGHTVSLQENCVRVPLTMSGPNIKNREIRSPTSLKDIFGTVLDVSSVSSEYPTLFDDRQDSVVLSETFGVDLSDVEPHVDNITEEVEKFSRLRRAAYGEESCVHRCPETGAVEGDQSLISSLDKLVDGLDKASSSEQSGQIGTETQQRLEDLGYV